MQKEEEKYNFYISQLSLKDSDTDTETDGSDNPFPAIEPEAVGTIPKDSQAKLNSISKEEGELMEQELRM